MFPCIEFAFVEIVIDYFVHLGLQKPKKFLENITVKVYPPEKAIKKLTTKYALTLYW